MKYAEDKIFNHFLKNLKVTYIMHIQYETRFLDKNYPKNFKPYSSENQQEHEHIIEKSNQIYTLLGTLTEKTSTDKKIVILYASSFVREKIEVDIKKGEKHSQKGLEFSLLDTTLLTQSEMYKHFYTRAAFYRNAKAQLWVANEFMHNQTGMLGQCHKTALNYYKKSAYQNFDLAQYTLGCHYETGFEIDNKILCSSRKAFKYYKLSSDQGLAIAHYKVGHCYASGIGVKKSIKNASYYYLAAAEKNDPISQFCLAELLSQGQQISQTAFSAVEYYELASKNNYAKASLRLAKIYESVSGIAFNPSLALHYYFLAWVQHEFSLKPFKATRKMPFNYMPSFSLDTGQVREITTAILKLTSPKHLLLIKTFIKHFNQLHEENFDTLDKCILLRLSSSEQLSIAIKFIKEFGEVEIKNANNLEQNTFAKLSSPKLFLSLINVIKQLDQVEDNSNSIDSGNQHAFLLNLVKLTPEECMKLTIWLKNLEKTQSYKVNSSDCILLIYRIIQEIQLENNKQKKDVFFQEIHNFSNSHLHNSDAYSDCLLYTSDAADD